MLGVKVRLCAPRTLLPAGVDHWPVEIYTELDKAVRDVDGVMCLRLQLERQQAGLLPDLAEYSRRFCLGTRQLALAMGCKFRNAGQTCICANRFLVQGSVVDEFTTKLLDHISALRVKNLAAVVGVVPCRGHADDVYFGAHAGVCAGAL